ncbi:Uncharacterised protein [uncultured archaeon]|nr:Uncharacterised protein [uncultured archaeon]
MPPPRNLPSGLMKRSIESVFTARAIPAEDRPIASILEYESILLRRVGISKTLIAPSPFIRSAIPAMARTAPPQ